VWEGLHNVRVPVKLIVGEFTDKESEGENPLLRHVMKFYEMSRPSHALYELMEAELPSGTRMVSPVELLQPS
jgi:hypothetical protein